MTATRVVIVGGRGNFGTRISRALSADPGIEVLAAGRRAGTDVQLDLASVDFASRLRAASPQIVIHCAGPFQGQDYRVAKASLAAGAHYIDVADGRAFVARFGKELNGEANAAGRLALSGASTLPALSAAVLDHFAPRFRALEEVRIAIAPGQRAVRGAATLEGVFSYAGRSFKWLSGGEWRDAWGWQELTRMRFAQMGTRWAAACDVPDLELVPLRHPGVRTVEFRAALELSVQHLFLWLAAGLRRMGVPMPIERWAKPLDRVATFFDGFGGKHGGMVVSLVGVQADGSRRRVEWHLTAPASDGPEIPCMAAILLARKLARGLISERGAYACTGFLALNEFAPEFARWRMTTAIEEAPA